MNILNVFYNFTQGGVERLGISVANQLAKQGKNSFVCIISETYSQELINKFAANVNIFLLKRYTKAPKFNYIKQLIKIIKSNNINVMHVHQGTLMPFYMIIKAFCPKLKIYFTVHDTYIYSELSKTNRIIAKHICKKMIAISDAVTKNMVENKASPNKIVRIYNGVDFSDFPLKNDIDYSKNSNGNCNKNSTVQIVNVARFFPEKKGQDLLIKAASKLKENNYNFHIKFAGGEPENAKGEINKMQILADKLGVFDRISFLGNVNNIVKLLNESDIFCIPSRYEGFGISAVEAMGTGLPCVASDIPGLNEVVNAPILGELFQSENADSLAQKLMYVIDNLQSYSADEISGNVNNRFSIETMAEQLINTYSM